MCLVKVKGEIEDDVIVPARVAVVEREAGAAHHHHTTTSTSREVAVVANPPPIAERPSRAHRHSSSSSSSNSITSITSSYISNRDRRRYRREREREREREDSSYGRGSFHGGSSYDGRSRSRDRQYYHDDRSSVSRERGGAHHDNRDPRGSYRYVESTPRDLSRGGGSQRGAPGYHPDVKEEIRRAEEHLARAAHIEERERSRRAIAYDPRASDLSRDGSRRRSDVVVVQEREHRLR